MERQAWLNGRLLRSVEQAEPGSIETILRQLEDTPTAILNLLAEEIEACL